MRIAILTWESLHSIAIGGLAAHVSELSEVLAQQGHEVHIFTRIAEGQEKYELIDGVHYHRCAYEATPDFVNDMDNMCRAFVSRVVATEDLLGPFDIIHAHDWLVANAMIWLKQARGRRCILTIHSTEYGRCGNTFPEGISARIREHERAGVYWADHVITVSQVTKEEVMWLYGVPDWKVTVIHNGVFARRFNGVFDTASLRKAHGIRADERVILFCGRLAHQKGPDLLIEALPEVIKQAHGVRVLFAGDGDMKAALQARATELKLDKCVTFLGYQKGADLPALFHAADIVCIPSRNEPFGIVVLEAWSARKPVVVSRIGGPREFVTDGVDGVQIEPDPPHIASALIGLLSDPVKARRMGEQGRLAVERRFTWAHIAKKTAAVYDPDLRVEPSETAVPVAKPEVKAVPAGLRLAVEELANADYRMRFTGNLQESGPHLEELLRMLETCSRLIREHVMPQLERSHQEPERKAAPEQRLAVPGPEPKLPLAERDEPAEATPTKTRRHKPKRKVVVAE